VSSLSEQHQPSNTVKLLNVRALFIPQFLQGGQKKRNQKVP